MDLARSIKSSVSGSSTGSVFIGVLTVHLVLFLLVIQPEAKLQVAGASEAQAGTISTELEEAPAPMAAPASDSSGAAEAPKPAPLVKPEAPKPAATTPDPAPKTTVAPPAPKPDAAPATPTKAVPVDPNSPGASRLQHLKPLPQGN